MTTDDTQYQITNINLQKEP